MVTSERQPKVSRRELLATGILFLFLSVTLFVYGRGPFKPSIWTWTWDTPVWISQVLSIIVIILLVVSVAISIACLIGIFRPQLVDFPLRILARHRNWKHFRLYFGLLYFFAFTISFFTSWVRDLVSVTKQELLFFILYGIGLIWAVAIIYTFSRKSSPNNSKIGSSIEVPTDDKEEFKFSNQNWKRVLEEIVDYAPNRYGRGKDNFGQGHPLIKRLRITPYELMMIMAFLEEMGLIEYDQQEHNWINLTAKGFEVSAQNEIQRQNNKSNLIIVILTGVIALMATIVALTSGMTWAVWAVIVSFAGAMGLIMWRLYSP